VYQSVQNQNGYAKIHSNSNKYFSLYVIKIK
jgi:hypothetical protein